MSYKQGWAAVIFCIVVVLGLAGWFIKRQIFYDPTVWTQDLVSPDGAWIATATTRQWGGFGTAWVETSVSLRTTGSKFVVDGNKPFDIFSYPDGHIQEAYILSDRNRDVALGVRWLSPKQLVIGRPLSEEPDLVVLRRARVDIVYLPGTLMQEGRPAR